MRLSNFSILTGPKVTVSDVAAAGEIASGSRGSEVTDLDRKSTPGIFTGMMTHYGDDNDENPYGNANFFDGTKVNTETELELSQSLGSPITGSAEASFLFIVEKNFRG